MVRVAVSEKMIEEIHEEVEDTHAMLAQIRSWSGSAA